MMFNLFLSLLSALLLVASFPPYAMWWCAWFACVPLLIMAMNSPPKKAFLFAYLTGCLFFALIISWMVHVNVIGYCLLVLALGMYFAVFAYCASRYYRSVVFNLYQEVSIFLRVPPVLYIAAIWAVLEYVRSSFATGFGWALLGYSQSSVLPVIQIASLTGVWGVSFVVMMVNAFIAELFFFKRVPRILWSTHRVSSLIDGLLVITVLGASLLYGFHKVNAHQRIFPEYRITVVQGSIPQQEKWVEKKAALIMQKYTLLTQIAKVQTDPDLIVWPETALPGYIPYDKALTGKLIAHIRETGRPFLVGAPSAERVSTEEVNIFNSAFLFTSDGRIHDQYRKRHLVPFGEYIPFPEFFSFLPSSLGIGAFSPGSASTVFTLPTESVGTISFASVICFEDVFPRHVRAFVVEGAEFIINITNDAWFMKTAAAYQHAQASIFRAVENGIWVVRAANTGLSCFIAPTGEVVKTVADETGDELFVTGYATGAISPFANKTFFAYFGEAPFLCIISLLSLFGLLHSSKVKC